MARQKGYEEGRELNVVEYGAFVWIGGTVQELF